MQSECARALAVRRCEVSIASSPRVGVGVSSVGVGVSVGVRLGVGVRVRVRFRVRVRVRVRVEFGHRELAKVRALHECAVDDLGLAIGDDLHAAVLNEVHRRAELVDLEGVVAAE
jgi:hypothetical protein